MDKIIKYYKLCDIKSEDKKSIPIVTQVERRAVSIIFTQRQVSLYLKPGAHGITVRENVVGGNKRTAGERILVVC